MVLRSRGEVYGGEREEGDALAGSNLPKDSGGQELPETKRTTSWSRLALPVGSCGSEKSSCSSQGSGSSIYRQQGPVPVRSEDKLIGGGDKNADAASLHGRRRVDDCRWSAHPDALTDELELPPRAAGGQGWLGRCRLGGRPAAAVRVAGEATATERGGAGT